jgi:hypothetical protein
MQARTLVEMSVLGRNFARLFFHATTRRHRVPFLIGICFWLVHASFFAKDSFVGRDFDDAVE